MPKSAQELIGVLKGEKAEARAETLIRAMVAAAKAEGGINEAEIALIKAHRSASADALKVAINQLANPSDIAALADNPQAAREIYAVPCQIVDSLSPKERDYLDHLAMALNLNPEISA